MRLAELTIKQLTPDCAGKAAANNVAGNDTSLKPNLKLAEKFT
ncbi:hypothetical protein ACSX1A_02595 [Pontibacter sp. MBLB2868]